MMRLLSLVVPALLASSALAQSADPIKSKYTKYEFMIPMRDGVKLFTAIYAPKEDSQRYPIMLTRTPYSVSPYGVDNYKTSLGPSDLFSREGYIFAYQDVRGRYMSEGEFVNVRPVKANKGPKDIDESTDTWDTIDWLVKNIPNNNGRVGMWGISYPGFYAAAGAIDAHPALKAVSPQAPIADWFVNDDFHHNGALFLVHAFNFLGLFGRPRPEPTAKSVPAYENTAADAYRFFLDMGPLPQADEKYFKGQVPFWNEMARHANYDEFWKERDLRPHLKGMKPAVMTVGGWFDAEDLFGALKVYDSIERSSPGAFNVLVMGPWVHGGWARTEGDKLGDVNFGSNTSAYYREQIELPFFEKFLKDKGSPKIAEASVFLTGINEWRRQESWPPKKAKAIELHFGANGKLAFSAQKAQGFDEYPSDPAKPVPFVPAIDGKMSQRYMDDDQRFASSRPDVVVYQTEPLQHDMILAGPITASLHVSTTGTDSDWVVKLVDVYPDNLSEQQGVKMSGYQQLVRGEPFRGRFRKSFEKPEPFVPGEIAKVEFTLPDIYHAFRRGHRIMVQVQSSWFPLVDRNPQKFVDIYQARESDFQKATQRVYWGGKNDSFLRVLSTKSE